MCIEKLFGNRRLLLLLFMALSMQAYECKQDGIIHKVAEKIIQNIALRKGIKFPLKLGVLSISLNRSTPVYSKYCSYGSEECIDYHKIEVLKASLNVSETLGTIHHELGHAKWEEQDPCREDLFCKKAECTKEEALYSYTYQGEQFADEQVPNNRSLLKAGRDKFKKQHDEIISLWKTRRPDEPIIPSQKDMNKKIDELVVNFSRPVQEIEEQAKEFDSFHKEVGDGHPSHFRRSHRFNERLNVLEDKELAQSIAKGALFDQFSQALTTSEMLS